MEQTGFIPMAASFLGQMEIFTERRHTAGLLIVALFLVVRLPEI
jgi:hypothetical protein